VAVEVDRRHEFHTLGALHSRRCVDQLLTRLQQLVLLLQYSDLLLLLKGQTRLAAQVHVGADFARVACRLLRFTAFAHLQRQQVRRSDLAGLLALARGRVRVVQV